MAQLKKSDLEKIIANPLIPPFAKEDAQKKLDSGDYSDFKKSAPKKSAPKKSAPKKSAPKKATPKKATPKNKITIEDVLTKTGLKNPETVKEYQELVDEMNTDKYKNMSINQKKSMISSVMKIDKSVKKATPKTEKRGEVTDEMMKVVDSINKKSILDKLIEARGFDVEESSFEKGVKIETRLKDADYPDALIDEILKPSVKVTTEGEKQGYKVLSILDIKPEYQSEISAEIVKNAKANIFEAGFKYADFTFKSKYGNEKMDAEKNKKLKAFFKKHNFKDKGEITLDVTNSITKKTSKTTYEVFANETTVIAYSGGYSSLVSIDAKEGFKIWKDIVTGGIDYLKDVDAFFNYKGGIDVEESLKILGEKYVLDKAKKIPTVENKRDIEFYENKIKSLESEAQHLKMGRSNAITDSLKSMYDRKIKENKEILSNTKILLKELKVFAPAPDSKKKPRFKVGDYVAFGGKNFRNIKNELIQDGDWDRVERLYIWRKVKSVGTGEKISYRIEGKEGLVFEDELERIDGVGKYESIVKDKRDEYWAEVLAGDVLREKQFDLKDFTEGKLTPSKVLGRGASTRFKNPKKVAYNYLKEQMLIAKGLKKLIRDLLKDKLVPVPDLNAYQKAPAKDKSFKGEVFKKYFTTKDAQEIIETLKRDKVVKSIDSGETSEGGFSYSIINVYTDYDNTPNPYGLEMAQGEKGRMFLIPLKPNQELPSSLKEKAPAPAPETSKAQEESKAIKDCKKVLNDANYKIVKKKTAEGRKQVRVKRPDKKILTTKMESVFKTIEKDVPKESNDFEEINDAVKSISNVLTKIIQSLDKLAKAGDLKKIQKIAEMISKLG